MQRFQNIGFPPPLLGPKPIRLALFKKAPGAFLLEKPAGFSGDIHPWYKDTPSIVEGLRLQITQEKPELADITGPIVRTAFALEPEVSGGIIYATEEGASAAIRNAVGSSQFTFTFHFITKTEKVLEATFTSELPFLAEDKLKRCRVTHKHGKKACTHFTRLLKEGLYELWEAKTTYPRFHQIRLHAFEAGIPILGETLYAEVPLLTLGDIKRRGVKGDKERPLYNHMAFHLAAIEGPWDVAAEQDKSHFSIPYPSGLEALKRHLFKETTA